MSRCRGWKSHRKGNKEILDDNGLGKDGWRGWTGGGMKENGEIKIGIGIEGEEMEEGR